MTPKDLLDKWWNTEPFGFDHPDTYNGILKLMEEIRLATIEECSEIVSTTRDRGDACRKLLNLALSQSEENKG